MTSADAINNAVERSPPVELDSANYFKAPKEFLGIIDKIFNTHHIYHSRIIHAVTSFQSGFMV